MEVHFPVSTILEESQDLPRPACLVAKSDDGKLATKVVSLDGSDWSISSFEL